MLSLSRYLNVTTRKLKKIRNRLHCGYLARIIFKIKKVKSYERREKLHRLISLKNYSFYERCFWNFKMMQGVVLFSSNNLLFLRINLFTFYLNFVFFLWSPNIVASFIIKSDYNRYKKLKNFKCFFLKKLPRQYFIAKFSKI